MTLEQVNFLAPIGRVFLAFLATTGRLGMFAGNSIKAMFSPPWYGRAIFRQMIEIGFYSLPVVGLTAPKRLV